VKPGGATAAGLLCAALAGCTFGVGSPYVGEWRARREVDQEICIEDAAGGCAVRRTLFVDVPARRYWGQTLGASVGGGTSSWDGDSRAIVRVSIATEHLRGHGAFAWGVRAAYVAEGSDRLGEYSVPLTLLAHYGGSEHVGFYAGLGYTPYTRLRLAEPDGRVVVSHRGTNLVGGLQWVMRRNPLGNRVVTILEAGHHLVPVRDRPTYNATTVQLSFALFF
jgi:hypothetical protein